MSRKMAPRLTITLPEPQSNSMPIDFDVENYPHLPYVGNGSTTAPIFLGKQDEEPPQHRLPRRFSFGNTTKGYAVVGSARKARMHRQKNISGESAGIPRNGVFSRAISLTYTFASNASSSIPADEWKLIFDKLDYEADGVADGTISVDAFTKILNDDPLWSWAVPQEIQETIIRNVDKNHDNVIDFSEFMDLVRGRQIPGFGRRRRRILRELLKQTVDFIVPYQYQYQNQYSCSPPPIFIIVISLLQFLVFAYDAFFVDYEFGTKERNTCSYLIFHPEKRFEVWRYFTYMFIHSGLFHIIFNILVQLVIGIPLEMVHGWWRVMLVYLSGVFAGSLWTNVLIPNVYLSGASGGVYALITAHLGTVIMNYREMSNPLCRLFIVCLVTVTDVSVYIYEHYNGNGHFQIPISYPAHISGAVSGFLVGITCLKNLRWQTHERYIWIVSIVVFLLLVGSAIVYSLTVSNYYPEASSSIHHETFELISSDLYDVNCSSITIIL